MTSVMGTSFARQQMAGIVLSMFAAVGLALAVVGLYGLMSQQVAERRHELSVRMALGADRRAILRLVLTAGCSMIAVGGAIGIAASLGASRVLRELLFGVEPGDPLSIVAASVALIAGGVLACVIPSYRAVRIPPSEVLKA
jgi:ABC-type antimicrobial peptide transport system permease subunit